MTVPDPTLSRQEWLVLLCWTAGMTVQQTAYSLAVGIQTVKEYRKRVRRKMKTTTPHLTGRTPTHA